MTKNTWFSGIRVIALGLLATLAACAPAANAHLGGDTLTITARLHTPLGVGPFTTDITVGPGAELADGSGTLGGYPRTGESVDCDNVRCVFTFAPPGLQGAFELSGLDSLIGQDLIEITIGGDLVASSDSHLTIDNQGGSSFARFTVDCNGFLAVNPCQGGTVEVNFIFAPAGGGDPLQALNDLRDAVIAQGFSEDEEEELIEILEDAIKGIEDGEPDEAIAELNDFIEEVDEFMEEQEIGTIGDALIAVAQEIIDLLQAA